MASVPPSSDEINVQQEATEEIPELEHCIIDLPAYKDRQEARQVAAQEIEKTSFASGRTLYKEGFFGRLAQSAAAITGRRDSLPGGYTLGRVVRGAKTAILVEAHDSLDNPVLIKFLRKEHLTPFNRALFEHSIEVGSDLPSEHFARTVDSGVQRGVPYYVVEDLFGKSLVEVLQHRGALEWQFAFFTGEDMCDALGVLHGRGIVHRDVTPNNMIVVPSEEMKVKLIDFDLSWSKKLEAKIGVNSERIIGTPAFISPEAASVEELDSRSDIYTLGCTLYTLISGRSVFLRKTFVEHIIAHTSEDPTPLSEIVPDIPKEVEQIVMRCLEKDADDRFQTVEDLKAQLSSALS